MNQPDLEPMSTGLQAVCLTTRPFNRLNCTKILKIMPMELILGLSLLYFSAVTEAKMTFIRLRNTGALKRMSSVWPTEISE